MKKHSGITLIGFIFILIIGAFFALMAMKLVPAYMDYFGVVKVMEQVASTPGSADKSLRALRAQLKFKGSFQYVDESTFSGKGAVRLVRENGKVMLVVAYDDQIHFIYNIDFLLHFKKTVQLSGSVG